MKTAIIDSSSAILLYRCNLIPALLKYCTVLTSDTVFSELTVPGYDGAELFSDLCVAGSIKIAMPDSAATDRIKISLHAGEREVIALFSEGKGDVIILDDGKGSIFCRDNNIPYINALLAAKIMYFKGLIAEPEYSDAWRWLIENGRYSERVKIWAESADEDKLKSFI